MTQRWRTLALVYLATNARYGSGVLRRRCQRVMSRPEREAIADVLERVPTAVAAWSDGLAALDPFDVVEVRRPLRTLSSSGGGRWWAGPRDCRDDVLELAGGRRYDAIYAIWPSDGQIALCGWGCTVGPTPVLDGAGFSSIASDHWATLATDPDPEQGYVHEWLHQVEATYRALGLSPDELPDLHDAGAYSSDRPADEPPFGRTFAEHHDGGARTWAPWYRDYLTGRLLRVGPDADRADHAASGADGPPRIGLTPERWALRSRADEATGGG